MTQEKAGIPLSPGTIPRTRLMPPAQRARRWGCCLLAAVITGCGEPPQTVGEGVQEPGFITAATLGEQDVRTASEYLAMEPYASADRERGERLAGMCRACHTFGAGEPAMLGPNLYGVFGRRAGSVGNFDYSAVLREANFVWTPGALDAWLAQPARFLPGNRMSFTGVQDAGDRANLIAYLLEVSDTEN